MNQYFDEHFPVLETMEDESSIVPEEEVLGEEYGSILEKMIDGLPEKQRILVILYSYEGWTLKKIGEYLNLSEPRTEQLYRLAMLHLKEKLMREE